MADFFDDLLNLEESAYQEGYAAGAADGQRAGLLEGRIFGLEKGFEKFLELGRLQGRSAAWAARADPTAPEDSRIKSERAVANVKQLELILTHPPFRNEEEEVEEVEETLKKAKAKMKVLGRTLGERVEEVEEKGKAAEGEGSGQVVEF